VFQIIFNLYIYIKKVYICITFTQLKLVAKLPLVLVELSLSRCPSFTGNFEISV